MKYITKLIGLLLASIALAACGGGGSGALTPVKTEKVWKLVKKETEIIGGVISFTFEYDGSGLLERVINSSNNRFNFELTYDAQGALVQRDRYNHSGEIMNRTEFDKYGEATSRWKATPPGSVLVKDIFFKNKYPDGLVVDKKEIQKYVQRKNLQTVQHSIQLAPYLGSNLVSRVREISYESIVEYDYSDANKIVKNVYFHPDDRVVDRVIVSTYDKYGNIYYNGFESDHVEDEHENLITSIKKSNGFQTHYTWKEMDIPVE